MSILDSAGEARGADSPTSGFVTIDEFDPAGADPHEDFFVRLDFVNERTWPPTGDNAAAMRGSLETMVVEASATGSGGRFDDMIDEWRGKRERRQWWGIKLRRSERAPVVRLYPNLFLPPLRMHVESVSRIDNDTQARLNQLCGYGPREGDSEIAKGKILDALWRASQGLAGVGVVDVGQGSTNVLLRSDGVPLGYFDCGGSITSNRRSWPEAFESFCPLAAEREQIFILSHWDLDHWAAHRDCAPFNDKELARAVYGRSTWIVPPNPPGDEPSISHMKFFDYLRKTAREVWIWPDDATILSDGVLTVMKCTGRDRNEGGLALIVGERERGGVLLTGDASLSNVPEHGRKIGLVVSPHHGAFEANEHLSDDAQIVVSFGKRNTFGHPDYRILREWRRGDWLATADRDSPDGVKWGSVLIDLSAAAAGFEHCKGGHCPMVYTQDTRPR